MKRRSAFLTCIVTTIAVIFGFFIEANADTVDSYVIRNGTLEPNPGPGLGYIFRSKNEKEIFDISPHSNTSRGIPGLFDLVEVGFKLSNGAKYFYKNESVEALKKRAIAENPGAKGDAFLFRGIGGAIIEIKLNGKTPVIRVDIKSGNSEVTLWSNIEETEPPKKGEDK